MVLACVLFAADVCASAQDQPPAPQDQQNEFFSGVVSDLSSGRIVVSRSAMGRNETRSFLIASETRVEGKLRVGVRVTVRFRTSDEGDVAVHIIVRNGSPARDNYRGKSAVVGA